MWGRLKLQEGARVSLRSLGRTGCLAVCRLQHELAPRGASLEDKGNQGILDLAHISDHMHLISLASLISLLISLHLARPALLCYVISSGL